jgi:hypothetical protein
MNSSHIRDIEDTRVVCEIKRDRTKERTTYRGIFGIKNRFEENISFFDVIITRS